MSLDSYKLSTYHLPSEQADDLVYGWAQFESEHFNYPWELKSWQLLLTSGRHGLIIELKRDELMVGMGVCFYQPGDTQAHLVKIVISGEFRRIGLGQQIFDHLKSQLLKLTMDEIYLEVELDNKGAQAFYLSNGAVELNQKKNFYGKGRHAVIMTIPTK